MNTQAQNIRKLLETLEAVDSIQIKEMDISNSDHISGMLRSFSKVVQNEPSDMAAIYMIEAADLIDQLLHLYKNR